MKRRHSVCAEARQYYIGFTYLQNAYRVNSQMKKHKEKSLLEFLGGPKHLFQRQQPFEL